MCRGLRNVDIFAKPVSFTYKKEEEFTTIMGGICSIFVFLIIGSFFLSETIMLFYSPDHEYEKTSEVNPFAIDNEPLLITPSILMMAG